MDQDNRSSKKEPQKKRFPLWKILVLFVCAAVFVGCGIYIISSLSADQNTDRELDDLWQQVRPGNQETQTPTQSGVSSDPVAVTPNTGEISSVELPDPSDETLTEDPVADETLDRIGREREDDSENTSSDAQYIPYSSINLDDIDYLKGVDLDRCLEINSDTVGWFYFPGPSDVKGIPIDISIVQTTDNEYYLDHSFNGSENINGWVYMDYECTAAPITSNYNTVIYGHARSNRMFGGLKELYNTPKWYTNANNHFIKINTATEETVWQIFAWYETTTQFNYIRTSFASGDEFVTFANSLQDRNMISSFKPFTFSENDRILTLSTCKGYDKNMRVAVHAVLVKSRPVTE